MRGKPHPKIHVEPAIVTAGAGNWLAIGLVVAVALLAGCAGPGHYPLSGQSVDAGDPVLRAALSQSPISGGGF
ncbi:hypothetical protein [Phaeobacter porticola]|uniref:Uncharacterized protein n=1 Tax=Phaeobacter porticola TaxID=1844006 RepID=A0A1L3I391_9RHOB|nr:hypothetical protein [Phaeobacter porticola]APG46566.1 hypothetical protein PhaeoP97_01140 [Phaeobacter porticola]